MTTATPTRLPAPDGGEFVLVSGVNEGVCPGCGKVTRELWRHSVPGAVNFRVVACVECADPGDGRGEHGSEVEH